MKQKLNAKDFILIGVLTALMWIICMIISTIMSVAGPVTNVFYPSVVAIPNGIVMMLLLAKVPKKGVFTICSAIQAILFLLVGAFWFIPIGLVIGGVICDFLVMGRKEITMKSMTVAYALFNLEPRGTLFVEPGDPVYEGMIVGEHNRDNDIDVNATKEKKLTNLRAAGKDENVILTPVKKMTLEHALHFVREDELVEVTPVSLRLRKVELSAQKRYQMAGAKKKA